MRTSVSYPHTRLRRNRKTSWSRAIVSENHLSVHDLILPIFIIEGKDTKETIASMPDFYRFTIDLAIEQAKIAAGLGIPAVILFPCIDQKLKSFDGNEVLNSDSLIYRAINAIKNAVPNIGVITDVALDPYTTHGHDGVLNQENGKILNDETINILAQQALLASKAGCDIVAPSDMMDGRIHIIRETLENNKFYDVQIMAYSAKYASNFYGPFRDALGSKNNLRNGDKKTYHMHYHNTKEAVIEVEMDIIEGADMIIIKPGMPYLDIIRNISSEFNIPVIGYQVSGEYAMLKLGAKYNLFDEKNVFHEAIMSFKRAGASAVITYAAIEIAHYLNSNIHC